MVERTTTRKAVDLELDESLKDELLATAAKKHAKAKKKKFKDHVAQGLEAKKRIRFYDKKGSGYIKDGKKRYD